MFPNSSIFWMIPSGQTSPSACRRKRLTTTGSGRCWSRRRSRISCGVSRGELGARLSGGQRQRIGIARALYPAPEILILDEATSALDLETERAFADALEKLKGALTILTIAHRPATVQMCDRVIRLSTAPEGASAGK